MARLRETHSQAVSAQSAAVDGHRPGSPLGSRLSSRLGSWLRDRLGGQSGGWLGSQCRVCSAWSGHTLCATCQARFAPARLRCRRCALPVPTWAGGDEQPVCGHCLGTDWPLSETLAAVDYGFPWDRLIGDLKFRQQPELARPLGGLLARAVRQAWKAAGSPDRVQAVLPMPTSPARLAERGYNPAWELTRHAARGLELPAQPQALRRWRDTPHQVGLDREARRANLCDSFWVPPDAAASVTGRHLALVDDVLTTGATAAEAARCLLNAGAASVQLWVLARTPPPHEPPLMT